MTKALNHAQVRMLTSDPLTQGMLLDPDAVMSNHDAWLANPQRELAKLTASLPRGMHGVTMSMTHTHTDTPMMKAAQERKQAMRDREYAALSPSAKEALADVCITLLGKC